MRSKLMLTCAAIATVLISSSAFASVVVVRSLGPSAKAYPPGKTLPEDAKITLQGGDVVTLIGPSTAKTLRGPGTFEANQVALTSAAGQRGRFGALRSGEIARNPSIWDVDATQSGKMCVADVKKLQIWHPQSEGAATVQIKAADGKSQALSWAAGKSLASWPAALPVKSGAEYELQWPDAADNGKVDFVLVSAPPTDLAATAQVLIENGCQNQLDLLVSSASKGGS